MKNTYWNNKIRNLDKLEKRTMLNEMYSEITDDDFQEIVMWVSGERKNPFADIFSSPDSARKLFLNCARENFPKSKERILKLNGIMGTFNGNESTYWR